MSAALPSHRFQVGCAPGDERSDGGLLLERGSLHDVKRTLAGLDAPELERAWVVEYAHDVDEVDDFHSRILSDTSAKTWLERHG